MSQPAGPQRLHPLTVLFEFARMLGRFLYAAVIILVARLFGGRSEFGDLALIALGGIGIAYAAARYATLRYSVENGSLLIRSGILFRQVRTVPLDRIQNVDLRQTLFQRIARVVDLRIETAGGEGAEVRLSLLSADAARRLARLVAPGVQAGGAAVGLAPADDEGPPPAPPPFWSASPLSLVLMGATENRAAAVLGGILGFYMLVLQVVGDERVPFRRAAEALSSVSGVVLLAALVSAFAGLLLAGWALSIGATVVRYFGFALRHDAQGRLVRRFGLTTRRESVIPIGRIQALRLEATWLRRRLGFWTVHVATAGSRAEQDTGGETLLAPFIAERELGRLCGAVFPALELDAAEWRPVSRHAIRRGFLRPFVLTLFVTALLVRPLGAAALVLLVPAAAACLGWSVLRWRALGYAGQSGLLLSRDGVWRRRIVVVPEGKIQSLALAESPFQRRLGIATLHVATAAAGHAGVRVVDLPSAVAQALQDTLTAGAARAGAWLPDGV